MSEPTLSLNLPVSMVQMILNIVGEAPFKVAAPIVAEVQTQVRAQQASTASE